MRDKKLDSWVCVFIGDKTVTTNANPMPLVHSILYWCCTGGIGFALIVTILSPLKTQNYTHVFFCCVGFLLQIKKQFNGRLSLCVFIGDQMVTIDANPMPPVQRRYSIECTRGIGFASIVTVLLPIKTQDYTCFFSVHVEFVPQPTWNLIKKNPLTDRQMSQNTWFWTT